MTIVQDTVHQATKRAGTIVEGAGSVARGTATDVAGKLTDWVDVARRLGVASMLSALGLQKRRGPLATVATFGAGVVVGAGAALLLAPVSGETLRRAVVGYFKSVKEKEPTEADLQRLDTDFDPPAVRARRSDARAS
jgi:hypothetical protein